MLQNDLANNSLVQGKLNQISQNYLSFLDQYIMPQQLTIRSSQYFTLFSQPKSTSVLNQIQDINLQQFLTVKLSGLINPKLTILQKYKLLNQFDEIFISQKFNTNKSIRHYTQPKSQKVRKFIIQLKKYHFVQIQKVNGSDGNNSDKIVSQQKVYYKFSLFFLYYIKKLYNSTWKRCLKPQFITEFIQNFQLSLIYAIYKMYSWQQINRIVCNLFDILQFDNYPLSLQQQNYHIGMQHFLLYKLHKSYGIRSQWSTKYQKQLKNIDINSFSILFKLQQRIDHHNISSANIEKTIMSKCLVHYSQQQNKQKSQVKIHFQQNQQIRQGVREIIIFLIDNLRNYQLPEYYTEKNNSVLDLFGLGVRDKDKENQQNISLINNNKNQQQLSIIQKLYKQYLPDAPQLNNVQYFTLKSNFTYLEQHHNQPTLLYQIKHPQRIFSSSSKQLFAKLVPMIVIDQYMRFKLFRRKSSENVCDWEFQKKRSFVQITSRSLVWKESIKAMEVDKLKVWELLFGLQYNPMTLQMTMTNINFYEPTLYNIITRTMREIIRNQLQPIIIIGQPHSKNKDNKTQQMKKQPLSLFMFPFIHLIILAYEIFSPGKLQSMISQLNQKYKRQALQQNLFQLVKDLNQQLVNCVQQKNDQKLETKKLQLAIKQKFILKKNLLQLYCHQLIQQLVRCQKSFVDAGIMTLASN